MIRYGQQSKFAKEVLSTLETLQPKLLVTEFAAPDDTNAPEDKNPVTLNDDETETD